MQSVNVPSSDETQQINVDHAAELFSQLSIESQERIIDLIKSLLLMK